MVFCVLMRVYIKNLFRLRENYMVNNKEYSIYYINVIRDFNATFILNETIGIICWRISYQFYTLI